MNRNNDSLNFDHKSHYNDDRDSYIDKNGNYVYTQWVKVGKSYERRVVDIIPLTEENRDIIILLDGSDHDMDLQEDAFSGRYAGKPSCDAGRGVYRNAPETSPTGYDLRPPWRRKVSGGSPPGGERAYRKGS